MIFIYIYSQCKQVEGFIVDFKQFQRYGPLDLLIKKAWKQDQWRSFNNLVEYEWKNIRYIKILLNHQSLLTTVKY